VNHQPRRRVGGFGQQQGQQAPTGGGFGGVADLRPSPESLQRRREAEQQAAWRAECRGVEAREARELREVLERSRHEAERRRQAAEAARAAKPAEVARCEANRRAFEFHDAARRRAWAADEHEAAKCSTDIYSSATVSVRSMNLRTVMSVCCQAASPAGIAPAVSKDA
jgi:hypothetical protein